jgi:hypothetical protein
MTRHVVAIPCDARKRERAYLEALQRIVDREPRSEKCRELLSGGGLTITQWSVAWESGQSRGPIVGNSCTYPRVAAAILLAQRSVSRPALSEPEAAILDVERQLRSERAVTRALRAQLRSMQREAELAYTKQGAAILLMEELSAAPSRGCRTDEEWKAARRLAEERVLPA